MGEHVYGCEHHTGCPDIGMETRVWRSGFGWYIAHLCPAHQPPDPGVKEGRE